MRRKSIFILLIIVALFEILFPKFIAYAEDVQITTSQEKVIKI